MAKTRMNSGHRTVLLDFAVKKIKEVVDRKHEQKLYAAILSQVNKLIRKKYLEEDMIVLRKYKLFAIDNCVKFVFPSGRVSGFTFNKEQPVDIPHSKRCYDRSFRDVYPATEAFEEMLEEHNKLKEESDKLYQQKIKDCQSLINFAKYVEDVLEVIKVPKDIEANLTARSTALVALSPDIIEHIQKDFSA